jgi:hypothetical protein
MTQAKQIDLKSRPETYWPESLTPDQLITHIHGKVRQDMARSIFNEKGFSGLTSFIAREELDEKDRERWGAIHPMFMGGEYLPSLEQDEVEIVRISLKSVTGDQISIRARRESGKIKYGVVGEYESMHYQQPFEESDKPLTLACLVSFIDGCSIPDDIYSGGLVIANWCCGFEENYDVDEAISFVAINSPFYPDLKAYYDSVAKEWCEEHREPDDDC